MPVHDALGPMYPRCPCCCRPDLRFEWTQSEVIGDFPEKAAQEFAQRQLDRLLLRRGQAALAMTEREWSMIYYVCGGNPLQLRKAVGIWVRAMREPGEMRPVKTLETGRKGDAGTVLPLLLPAKVASNAAPLRLPTALLAIWEMRCGQLQAAVQSSPAFAFVARRLCHAPHGALNMMQLDNILRGKQLGACVEDLIKENLLAVRPRSGWASDVPPEAFLEGGGEVVTACSAVDLYCLKRLEKNGVLPKVEAFLELPLATTHGDGTEFLNLLVIAGA